MIGVRRLSTSPRVARGGFSLQNLVTPKQQSTNSKQPKGPARTRFAPSPTGSLHLGSLRTALYNYLLARSTGGQFLLRLEDTDQNRLVPGAEAGIYKWLRWAGLQWDEGPEVGGPHGPYRQSERSGLYARHVDKLLASGHAYRCFCPKERLNTLAETARRLQPPSLASYDRKCSHLSAEESAARAAAGETHVVRLKSPDTYPPVDDVVHGRVNMQVQVNAQDRRFDDPVLLKSDGLPTYHLANVVDDHDMRITHVIRGDEWLASTPKHLALYRAFGWDAPAFCHIPLLTSLADKKLSKRSGDTGLADLAARGILPEALVNFVALYGWSPARETGVALSEEFTLARLEREFSLDGLTRGNAKVDHGKLMHFNSVYFRKRLADPVEREPILDACIQQVAEIPDSRSDIPANVRTSRDYMLQVLNVVQERVSAAADIATDAHYFFAVPDYASSQAQKAHRHITADLETTRRVYSDAVSFLNSPASSLEGLCPHLFKSFPKKTVFPALRYALAGGAPGVGIPELVQTLGHDAVLSRISNVLDGL